MASLEAAVNANGQDLDARYALAMAYFAQGSKEDAMAQLLESIRQDKDHNDAQAKNSFLSFLKPLAWVTHLS